ncbi:MAG: aspartyl/asparaginyl beta-hydroxylase domain-containing protein [Actinomycetota bacterium]|nr:aspartyl/asparaginyl beta-hydroxylase domain-containing protein [Actinomycetota bacterium]
MASTLKDKIGEASLEAGARVLQGLGRLIARSSLVDTTPYLSPYVFGWVQTLEANWHKIRAELDEVLRFQDELPNFQDISVDQATITDDDKWKTYFFYGYGFKSEANCARCPETTKLLEAIPGMKTAFFSILGPHKHIPEHCGPWKGVLRYHLALIVPEPRDKCGIKVDGEVTHWEEGKSLLFDDSFEHAAWNDTDGTRVVLFMDVVRPLKSPASYINSAVIKAVSVSPYIQDAKQRHSDWEKGFEEKHES